MYKLQKRILDLIISFTALFILSPLFIFCIILLSVSGEREIFYFQKRIGLNNSNFFIWKFATMIKNSMNLGSGSITLKNDPRVTYFGKFLRKTKINELPQVINVIKGDLSIVGPRPLVYETFNCYSQYIQDNIYKVKPGITGIGSIIFRDEESLISSVSPDKAHSFYKNKIAPFKGKLELWYQKNSGIFLDIQLIFLTAWVIFFPNTKIHYFLFKNLPKRDF